MIPLRILLRGFLCYRDEQEILLDGSSLWMMAGLNGSGKSAIFDAMTFALFGAHRGGSQQLVELINHDCDKLAVEFDFGLDEQLYRIHRTVQRKSQGGANVTQQIYRLIRQDADSSKEAVPDTQRKNEFNAWIREHIGLTYETFTSSVLLLQGKAEKLLDSTASGRFEVLAGIVDLDRYRRLHERADTRRKTLKSEKDMLEHQLQGVTVVSTEDLEKAEAAIEISEKKIAQTQELIERLQQQERLAQQWAELQIRRGVVQERWLSAQGMIKEADSIQKAVARLKELKDHLPILRGIFEQRNKIKSAQKRIEQLTQQQSQTLEKLTLSEQALEQERRRQDIVRKQLMANEHAHRDVNTQLRDLSKLMSQVKLCEQQRDALHQLDLEFSKFPQGLEQTAQHLREETQRLSEIERVLPLLQRFHNQREELRRVRVQELECTQQEQAIRERGDKLRAQQELQQKAVAEAEKARKHAEEQLTEARTLLRQAELDLNDFVSLAGAKLCRSCGQPLTANHFAEEKTRREQTLQEMRGRFQQAEKAQRQSQLTEQQRREQLTVNEQALQQARDEYRDGKTLLKQLAREIERLRQELLNLVTEMPATHQQRLPSAQQSLDEWTAHSFPTDKDLEQGKMDLKQLAALRLQLRETESQLIRWQSLQTQRETTLRTLTSLEAVLPKDVGALRRKLVQLESSESELTASIAAARQEERQIGQGIDRLGRDLAEWQQVKAETVGKLEGESLQLKLSEQESTRLKYQLLPTWHDLAATVETKLLFDLQGEQERLEKADTEGKAQRLQQTLLSLESLKLQREEIEQACRRIPAEGQVDPATIQQQLKATRGLVAEEEKVYREAQRTRAILESQRDQHAQLSGKLLDVEKQWKYASRLADLLGRERLQRHLVRQAERQVVDHANGVLDRLSGGQLYLRLRGSEEGESTSEKALELEAFNRSTGQAPINVAFLSGSQRFRVAVSLALGLGQYASRQHRPIESVIIDEGFGCLDRQGRQVMVQELQNLRGQLRCILLVSHQEEFADAFNDGYLFELNNGATRIKRFQR